MKIAVVATAFGLDSGKKSAEIDMFRPLRFAIALCPCRLGGCHSKRGAIAHYQYLQSVLPVGRNMCTEFLYALQPDIDCPGCGIVRVLAS